MKLAGFGCAYENHLDPATALWHTAYEDAHQLIPLDLRVAIKGIRNDPHYPLRENVSMPIDESFPMTKRLRHFCERGT